MSTVSKPSPTRLTPRPKKAVRKTVAVTQTIEIGGKIVGKKVTYEVVVGATVGKKRRPEISAAKMRKLVAKNPPPQEWFDEDFSHLESTSTLRLSTKSTTF